MGPSNGAMGTIYYPLDFTSISSSPCTMYGYPGVAFVWSPGGGVVGAPAAREGNITPRLVTLRPGMTAHATLGVSDVMVGTNCIHDQVRVKWVQVYPPGRYGALFARMRMLACADPSIVTMRVGPVSSGRSGP